MKRYSYILILLFSGLLSCEKQPPVDPWMVNQVFSGEVNGVPFKTGMSVSHGASVTTDMCDKHVIAMSLVRKIEDKFEGLEFHQIERDRNMAADALSKIGSRQVQASPGVFIQEVQQPSEACQFLAKQHHLPAQHLQTIPVT